MKDIHMGYLIKKSRRTWNWYIPYQRFLQNLFWKRN